MWKILRAPASTTAGFADDLGADERLAEARWVEERCVEERSVEERWVVELVAAVLRAGGGVLGEHASHRARSRPWMHSVVTHTPYLVQGQLRPHPPRYA